MPSQVAAYPKEFDFSIVIKIEETIRNSTGKLYEELAAVNNVEVITEAEADIDLNN